MTNIVMKVSLWGQDVAAVVWDKENEYAIFGLPEFSAKGLDVAPLMMPLEDISRGDRTYYYPSNRNKTFKGLPGSDCRLLPDDYRAR
ncbi:hypothetical protein MASR1M46_20010 [Bacteroidales bacterium]